MRRAEIQVLRDDLLMKSFRKALLTRVMWRRVSGSRWPAICSAMRKARSAAGLGSAKEGSEAVHLVENIQGHRLEEGEFPVVTPSLLDLVPDPLDDARGFKVG